MKKIKVGIIGFGLAGKVLHGKLLAAHPDFEIIKILSSRIEEIKEAHPNAMVVNSIEELLSDDIDLVVNAGSNDIHYSYTKAALLADKHVVVEKPFVNTISEGEELIALAEARNLVLSVFHNRRWDSDFLTVKKLINENRLGNIKQFEVHFDRFNPGFKGNWREKAAPGSGILMDLGSHLIDQVLRLFGNPDEVIKDVAYQKNNKPVDDYFHLIFKYGEMRAIVHGTSFCSITPRYQIIGDKAVFIKYGLDPQENFLKTTSYIPGTENYGVESKEFWGTLTDLAHHKEEIIESEKGNYLDFYSNIAFAIREGRDQLLVKPEQALNVIKYIIS